MNRRAWLWTNALVALAMQTGCGKSKSEPEAEPSKADETSAVAGRSVVVELDGKVLAELPIGRFIKPVPLVDLLPETARDATTWMVLEIESNTVKSLPEPGKRFKGQQPALFRDPKGIHFGVYPLVPGDGGLRMLDRLTYRIDDIKRISVIRQVTEEVHEPATLVIRHGGKDTVLTEEQLRALPEVGQREGQWRILDVVGLAVSPGKVTSVTVQGENDGAVSFLRPVLVSGRGTPVLRLNRRRQIRLDRLGTEGGGGDGGGNKEDAAESLRDVHTLVVELRR